MKATLSLSSLFPVPKSQSANHVSRINKTIPQHNNIQFPILITQSPSLRLKRTSYHYETSPFGNQHLRIPSLKRKWSDFWKNGVKVKNGHHRRHIIMSKIMKNCVITMTQWSIENNKPEEVLRIYSNFINCPSLPGKKINCNHLLELQSKAYHKLNNMRFNVFIGNGYTNQVINDLANIFENSEDQLINQIRDASSKDDIRDILEKWVISNLDNKNNFKDKLYQEARMVISNNIKSILFPSNDCINGQTLPSLKNDIIDRILCIYDTLSSDMSIASNLKLRKWQNSKILPLQGKLQDIIKEPNSKDFESVLSQLSKLEAEGSFIIGLNNSKLNRFREYPEVINKFNKMITEN